MKVLIERERKPKGMYEEHEVRTPPLTVGQLREALAKHDADALVVAMSGDACTGFVKSVEEAPLVAFDEAASHMGGDALEQYIYNDEDRKREEARPEGYWRKAVFISPYPFWYEKPRDV